MAEDLYSRGHDSFDILAVKLKFYKEFLDVSWVGFVLYPFFGPSDRPAKYDSLLVAVGSWPKSADHRELVGLLQSGLEAVQFRFGSCCCEVVTVRRAGNVPSGVMEDTG